MPGFIIDCYDVSVVGTLGFYKPHGTINRIDSDALHTQIDSCDDFKATLVDGPFAELIDKLGLYLIHEMRDFVASTITTFLVKRD